MKFGTSNINYEMIRAIIVDDEKKSRETLYNLLVRYCKNVKVVSQANGFVNGVAEIKKHKPEVVFLDIQMPDGSGFKLLEEFEDVNFEVIFTTAYDQFAIKAIKYSTLDYLLKPIDPEDLINAVEKLEKKKFEGGTKKNVNVLLENLRENSNELRRIVLSTSEGMHVVDVVDVIRCESDDYYTKFFFTDKKMLMVSKTLKENEELLSSHNFIRPHKSHLINVRYIKKFMKNDGGYIILSDGSKIPVSRRKREQMVDIISHL